MVVKLVKIKDYEFYSRYWRYYLVLERDFLKIQSYVEFDVGDNTTYSDEKILNKANSETYSSEFIKQYQAICSEFDSVCKIICNHLGGEKCGSIGRYAKLILNNYVDLPQKEVEVTNMNISNDTIYLKPFSEWRLKSDNCAYKSPTWWEKYNKLKHNMVENFKFANLKNVIFALAGLFTIEAYFLGKLVEENTDEKERMRSKFAMEQTIKESNLFEKINF